MGKFHSKTQTKAFKLRLDERCEQVSVIAKGLVDIKACQECVGSVISEASCDANVQFDDLMPEFRSLELVYSNNPSGQLTSFNFIINKILTR